MRVMGIRTKTIQTLRPRNCLCFDRELNPGLLYYRGSQINLMETSAFYLKFSVFAIVKFNSHLPLNFCIQFKLC